MHLSKDVETGIRAGERHGKPTIFKVKAGQMFSDGIKFYLSQNGVWLTKYVEPKYIEKE